MQFLILEHLIRQFVNVLIGSLQGIGFLLGVFFKLRELCIVIGNGVQLVFHPEIRERLIGLGFVFMLRVAILERFLAPGRKLFRKTLGHVIGELAVRDVLVKALGDGASHFAAQDHELNIFFKIFDRHKLRACGVVAVRALLRHFDLEGIGFARPGARVNFNEFRLVVSRQRPAGHVHFPLVRIVDRGGVVFRQQAVQEIP